MLKTIGDRDGLLLIVNSRLNLQKFNGNELFCRMKGGGPWATTGVWQSIRRGGDGIFKVDGGKYIEKYN